MDDFLLVKEIEENIEFVKLIITKKPINAKDKNELMSVCRKNSISIENLASNIQVHSSDIKIVNFDNIHKKVEADALMTNQKGIPLLVFTADCGQIAFIDKSKKVIALAHAGWKGTHNKITKNVIENMKNVYKSDVDDIVCVVGPMIRECCYEVSKELIDKFKLNLLEESKDCYVIKGEKGYLDLAKINKQTLLSCGIKKENIIDTNKCTSCSDSEFYSYRKDNKTDKRIGMIMEII